ncbi:hypothetical protein Hanom_Chr01g00008511 [Helianthus anomalus]
MEKMNRQRALETNLYMLRFVICFIDSIINMVQLYVFSMACIYVFMLFLLAFSTSGMAGSLIHKSVTSKSVYLKPKKLMR